MRSFAPRTLALFAEVRRLKGIHREDRCVQARVPVCARFLETRFWPPSSEAPCGAVLALSYWTLAYHVEKSELGRLRRTVEQKRWARRTPLTAGADARSPGIPVGHPNPHCLVIDAPAPSTCARTSKPAVRRRPADEALSSGLAAAAVVPNSSLGM